MPWPFTSAQLAGASSVQQLIDKLAVHLSRLSRLVRAYEPTAILSYGATVRCSGELSRHLLITVTNGTAFLVANPISPREGVELHFDCFNNTAGVLGAVTFDTEFQLAGAFVAPLAGKRRLYSFIRTNDKKWRETGRSPADI